MSGRLAAALLAFVLAGCAASSPPPGGDPTHSAVLHGVVVDNAIRPLGGANVTLVASGNSTVTAADGSFTFMGLAPGAQALRVAMAGFLETTLTVQVEAGKTPTVSIVLERAVNGSPYSAAYTFEGFIDCGTGHFAACGAPFAVQTIVCGNGGPCTDNVTDGRFITFYTLDTAPTLVQSEVVWQTTQPLGDSLVLIHFASTPEERAGFGGRYINETVGPSPNLGAVNESVATASGLGINSSLAIGVYGGKYCGVPGVCHMYVGLVVQQRFRVITDVFYHYLPPKGWRFTDDGTVPPPA